MVAVAAALLVVSLDSRRPPLALAAGAAWGLACLVKPALLLFPLAAALVYRMRDRGHSYWLPRAGLYLVGTLALVAPWTLRNYLITGRLVPVSAGQGLMLYQVARYASVDLSMREYHEQVQSRDPRIVRAQAADDPRRHPATRPRPSPSMPSG